MGEEAETGDEQPQGEDVVLDVGKVGGGDTVHVWDVVRLGRHLRESVEGVGGVAGSSRSSIGQCLYIPARLGAHGFFVGSTELGPSATRPDLEILFTQVHAGLRSEISFQALCGRPCSSKGKAQTSARKSEKNTKPKYGFRDY